MLQRFKRWRSGRPYHKVHIVDEVGEKHSKIRFRDDEWSMMLLAMGHMGARTVEQAVTGALALRQAEIDGTLAAALEEMTASDEDDVPMGMYL